MGTFKKGILGGFSGKVGSVIGSSWNGIEYLRSLPKPSKKQPTTLQTIHRAKFGFANGFLRPLSGLTSLGFKSQAQQKTGHNVAVKHVMAVAITGIYPDYEVDYAKIQFSRGTLESLMNPVLTSTVDATVALAWMDNSGYGTANPTDKLVILVYNPVKNKFVYNLQNGAMRSESADTLIVPNDFSGDQVEVWAAFMTENQKIFSTSMHVGQVVIA